MFEADSEQVAKDIDAHFVGKGMKSDTGGRAFGAKFIFIFMSLEAPLEGDRSFRQAWTSAGLSSLKSMTPHDHYLADFETMYGDKIGRASCRERV